MQVIFELPLNSTFQIDLGLISALEKGLLKIENGLGKIGNGLGKSYKKFGKQLTMQYLLS